ncbi:MAG: TIGR02266 family protein [Myxococcota bacterium]
MTDERDEVEEMEIEDVDFDELDFEGIDFDEVEVEDVDLDDIDWDETDWNRTDWEEFVFERGVLRAQDRDDTRFQVFLNMEVETPSGAIQALSGNVSDGGVFVATPHKVEPGTIVTLNFKLPKNDAPLSLRGEVRWVQETFDRETKKVPGFGAKFIDLVSEDRYKLFRYIDKLKYAQKRQRESE